MRAAILLAFQIKARDVPKNVEPRGRVAADLDLRFDRSIRVEGLLEQIAHHARLRHVARGADVVDGEVVVDAHVALDEAGHLPIVGGAVEMFEDQDVPATCSSAVALAAALVVWMRQRGADGLTQSGGVARLGRADAICQTSFFHAAPCRTA
jgi:hypothetical protein